VPFCNFRNFSDPPLHSRERSRHDPVVRLRLVAIVGVVALAAAAVVVVAAAETQKSGLPSYTDGYQKWPKLNRKPFTKCGPPCAHSGTKNVYASKRKRGAKFPNGTVIVKSITQRGDKPSLPSQVAVMRKTNGRWKFVEYELSGSRYGVLAQGQLCLSCHMRVKSNDYVFTKR
jgi:Cytochrome P460